jgi:hypothetical protein
MIEFKWQVVPVVFLLAALSIWPGTTFAQDYDCSRIPPEATYDPSYAIEFSRQCPNGLSLGTLSPSFRTAPQLTPIAPIGFDQHTKKVFVNGYVFDADDNAAAVESVKALDLPPVQMPSNYRPMGPEEYGGYVKRSRYRLQHPIKGKIRSAINRIKNHFRGKQREYERRKRKIEKDIAQCYAIAESTYPGDFDAASDYADDCVDNLPSAKPRGEY